MLWSPKCSCQFLWRQIVIVMFTASQIKSSTHVSSSPKSKPVPSLPHVRTQAHHNNLYGSLDLLAIQELLGPPPFHALLQSPTSGVGQSPEVPRERLWWPPKKEKSLSVTSWNLRGNKNDQTSLWGDAQTRSLDTPLICYHYVSVHAAFVQNKRMLIESWFVY